MQPDGRRMLWRCRRGLLELDIMLARFVTRHYEVLTPSQLQAFDRLLDYPDNDLWDLVTGRKPSDDGQQQVLELIRNAHPTPPDIRA